MTFVVYLWMRLKKRMGCTRLFSVRDCISSGLSLFVRTCTGRTPVHIPASIHDKQPLGNTSLWHCLTSTVLFWCGSRIQLIIYILHNTYIFNTHEYILIHAIYTIHTNISYFMIQCSISYYMIQFNISYYIIQLYSIQYSSTCRWNSSIYRRLLIQ